MGHILGRLILYCDDEHCSLSSSTGQAAAVVGQKCSRVVLNTGVKNVSPEHWSSRSTQLYWSSSTRASAEEQQSRSRTKHWSRKCVTSTKAAALCRAAAAEQKSSTQHRSRKMGHQSTNLQQQYSTALEQQ